MYQKLISGSKPKAHAATRARAEILWGLAAVSEAAPAVESGIEDLDIAPPPAATAVEVAPRIRWLRAPLSGVVDHVNCWILDDGDAWTIVDFGASSGEVRTAWRTLLDRLLAEKPVRRLVATHGHSDHVGHAGSIAARLGLPLHATRTEWLVAAFRRGEARSEFPEYVTSFFERHGCDSDHARSYAEARLRWATEVDEIPPLIRIRAGDRLTMGGRTWEVFTSGGHSPEAASFWAADDRILIAGDHLLARSSPTLAISPAEPDADPLGDYLASLSQFDDLPDDTLVLPSHGRPYRGIRSRIRELRHHHEQRLARVLAAVDVPKTAMEVAAIVYPRVIADGRARLAFSEAIGRLNHLVATGAVVCVDDVDRRRFVRREATTGSRDVAAE